MKTTIFKTIANKVMALGYCLLVIGMLTSCSDDRVSDLQLYGDCMVEAVALDNYEGTIDLPSRTITVRLPEVYETSAMRITEAQTL